MPFFNSALENNQFLINTILFDTKDITDSKIEEYINSRDIKVPDRLPAIALVDTGATRSAITEKLAGELKLIPTGSTSQTTASEIRKSNIYFIGLCITVKENRAIHNRIFFLAVTDLPKIENPRNFDIIIGMDILREMVFQYSPYNLVIGF